MKYESRLRNTWGKRIHPSYKYAYEIAMDVLTHWKNNGIERAPQVFMAGS